MIACILAGGEGTRLRPISCRNPKPMTRLVTHPVMGHTLAHLHDCGIRRAAVTLRHMPELIRGFFGNGEDWGVELTYYEESRPLGTAGGVANCEFPKDEEVLVVSGDAVCDFDFREALAFHRAHHAEATILLSHQPEPLEYGVVECDASGRVERFAEKPSWNRVRTDTVNTGIYILSPSVLQRIAKGRPSDFSRDIFPEMLRRGDALYAYTAQGYWCDIGDCGAYLRCVHDALSGRVRLHLPVGKDGIYSLSPIPDTAEICPPVYIGRDVTIGRDTRIGPYTVLDDGASVGSGSVVEGSLLRGSTGENTALFEAIVERGSVIGDDSTLGAGCVLGENVRVGAHCEICPGVRIWPDCDTGENAVVRFNINAIGRSRRQRFSADAQIIGTLGCDLTPEFGASFGSALATVCSGAVGCVSDGSAVSEAFLQSIMSGIRLCGERAVLVPADFIAQGVYAAAQAGYGLTVAVYAVPSGLSLRLFSGDGLPADDTVRRKVENLLASADFHRIGVSEIGTLTKNECASAQYAAACKTFGSIEGRNFQTCANRAGEVLSQILQQMGAQAAQPNSAVFYPSEDGFSLEACDETGRRMDDAHMLACAFYALAETVDTKELTCPDDAPMVLASIAEQFEKQLIRPKASAKARDLLANYRVLHDGVMRAAFLAAYLSKNDLTLAQLAGRIPPFGAYTQDVVLHVGRAAFMRAAHRAGMDTHSGKLRFEPGVYGEILHVYAESVSVESAQALCEGFCMQARRLDTDIKRRKNREEAF